MARFTLIVLFVACSGRSDGTPSPPVPTTAPKPVPAITVPPSPAPTDAQAMAAYEAKKYAECAAMFAARAESITAAKGKAKEDATYSAACCYALDGKLDPAFAMLDRAIDAGMRNLPHLEKDPDIATLRADPRWARVVASVKDKIANWENSLKDPALRTELLELRKEDQAALMAANKDGKDPRQMESVKAIQARSLTFMKKVVAKHGWPGASIVGEDGANAAWLLVQHADADVAFQKLCLANMEPLVKTGEVTEIDFAYLYDRVAVNEKRLQRYGTQFNDKREPQPIEDEANVDARRKSIGLPSMAEYKQTMLKMYGAPK